MRHFSLSIFANKAYLLIAIIIATAIAPQTVQAQHTIYCTGTGNNDLYVGASWASNGFGSFRVNGSGGPNIPATMNNGGNVTITGPGAWTDLIIEQHNGVNYSLQETIGDFSCPPPPAPPVIIGQPGNATITHNQTTTLTVTATAATSYQWYQGASGNTGSPIGGATSSSYTTPALAASGSTYQYWVRVTNANGSVDSNTATVTVNQADTTTAITADSPDPSVIGQTITVNLNVTSANGTPTGDFSVGDGVNSCSGTLSGGTGSCSLALNTVGARTLTASYDGDANFNASNDTEAHTVNRIPTTTTITSNTPNPTLAGENVTVNFTVSASGSTPTGTVTVSDGVDSCNGVLSGGTGSCVLALTTDGARTLTATYPQTGNFAASSGTANHTVNLGSVTVNSSPLAVTEGSSNTYTISLNSNPGGTVTIAISFDGSAVTVNGSSTSPVNLNFSDTTPQTVTVAVPDNNFGEGSRSANITHAIVSGTTAYPNSVGVNPVQVNISDNDTVGVTVNPTTLNLGENGGSDTYTINLDTMPTSGNVTIDISFDTNELTVNGSGTSPVTLTFNSTTPQTVTVATVDNLIAEGDRTISVSHAITSGPAEYPNSLGISSVDVNITDDETPAVSVTPRRFTIDDVDEVMTYTIALQTMPTSGDVTIQIAFDTDLVTINNSSTSPQTLVLSDMTPATIRVRALENDLETTLRQSISASTVPEYPTSMDVANVVISLDTFAFPPPPPVPNARDWNFDDEAPVRIHVPHHLEDHIFVRLIVENGNFVVWYGSELYHEGHIGNLDVLKRNVLQAVDVFTQDFVPVFDGDVVVCLKGYGEMIFADANEAPRIPRQITAWMTPAFPGYTCATLYTPGSLFLVEGTAPTIMAEAVTETPPIVMTQLACYISTPADEFVNLRDAPQFDSLVVTVIPPNVPRWSTGYSNGFYQVQYGEYAGWLHESAVIPDADCRQ